MNPFSAALDKDAGHSVCGSLSIGGPFVVVPIVSHSNNKLSTSVPWSDFRRDVCSTCSWYLLIADMVCCRCFKLPNFCVGHTLTHMVHVIHQLSGAIMMVKVSSQTQMFR